MRRDIAAGLTHRRRGGEKAHLGGRQSASKSVAGGNKSMKMQAAEEGL